MLRLAADEDFNNRILRGLLRRKPDLDIVRVQDAGLTGKTDGEVLEWAAGEGRVLLTHDVTTMRQYVDERIVAGSPMPGVFEVSQQTPIAQAIEDILLIAECSLGGEWEGQIRFLPLR
jgi:predicted nuclease of predicted toxin-antitoxin system